MTAKLDLTAPEEGVYIVDADFKDEDGNAVVPTNVDWKLVDKQGTTVVSDTGVTPVAASMSFLLSGNDLAIPDGVEGDVDRYFRVTYSYVSGTFGALTTSSEVPFDIENHKGLA